MFVRINTLQYPSEALKCNFDQTARNYGRAYMMFMDAVNKYQDADTGSQITTEDFATIYPIFHVDVSKHHSERLIDSTADISVTWTLSGNFRNIANNADSDYLAYAVVTSDRYLTLNMTDGKMNLIM